MKTYYVELMPPHGEKFQGWCDKFTSYIEAVDHMKHNLDLKLGWHAVLFSVEIQHLKIKIGGE